MFWPKNINDDSFSFSLYIYFSYLIHNILFRVFCKTTKPRSNKVNYLSSLHKIVPPTANLSLMFHVNKFTAFI